MKEIARIQMESEGLRHDIHSKEEEFNEKTKTWALEKQGLEQKVLSCEDVGLFQEINNGKLS